MYARVPPDWKQPIITIVPRKNGDLNNTEGWRLISLLCTVQEGDPTADGAVDPRDSDAVLSTEGNHALQ